MTLPAARLGDQTVHGGVITIGCPTVLIGGKPAARIGDLHVCPMVTGVVPHVGGPIVLGAFTVLSGFAPQARVSDMAICVGPPDTIAMGEPTVLVGNSGGGGGGGFAGVAGAVVGGLVAGLRNLLSDDPKAVLQPDGTWATKYNDSITIEGTPEFQAQTVRDLNTISATPSGKKLMASMKASGKQCRIHTDNGGGNWAWTDPNPPAAGEGSHGKKTNTEIGYSPTRTSLSGPPGSPYNTANWAQSPNRPADVGLFHEMVHADDMMNGRIPTTQGVNTGAKAGTPIADSELRAVGLPPYSGQSYSENTYRADRKLPARTFY